MSDSYDVAILGGGLAGLTLALHLLQKRPGTRIIVIEKKKHPVDEAAHKVGESSVEIGAHYFTHVLGELEHFQKDELPKLGLRYFFDDGERSDIARRTELGGNVFFESRSWQIDRGRFENHLGRRAAREGVEFVDGATVTRLDLNGRNADQVVAIKRGDEAREISARWVVDAAGRASIIKRKLGLAKECGHDANAVWWRYDRHVKIDDWSADAAWQAQGSGKRSRWLSTVHFMGEGYWVWFIPLASGSHSVGIVADGKLHPFATMSSYEKAMQWLRDHEPQCAEVCEGREAQVQDFLGYKDYSYSCKQVYSDERWACVGEAGAFLDPFYSPGSDYIAMGNTFVVDLIEREMRGESIAARSQFYNTIYFTFFENHLSLYEDQMPLFGNAKVMAAKIVWDFAYYWVVPSAFFFHGRQTDLMMFAKHKAALDRSGDLNRRMQRLFRDWHRADCRIARTFFDIPGIPFMHALNRGLQDRLDDAQFAERLLANLGLLERLAAEFAGEARRDSPAMDLAGLPEPRADGRVELLATIVDQLRAKPAATAGA
jgi:flavin-dependent dehydrogenase